MIKKILLCVLLTWITCVLFLEVSIISQDILFNKVNNQQIDVLKKISFYSYNS
jgi:hypothetical protein